MKPIAESELILNTDFSVYHLQLHESEIADTIITVGDPSRVREVSKHFDKIEVKKQNREFVTHTGIIGKKRITVISTGIGPDNIDIVLTELDALVNVDLKTRLIKKEKKSLRIIRVGTSGALQADIPVDSFVASSFGLSLDNLLYFYQPKLTKKEINIANEFSKQVLNIDSKIHPIVIAASDELIKLFSTTESDKLKTQESGIRCGITVTCPGFYGPQGRVVRNKLAYPNLIDNLNTFQFNKLSITNFEMETSAIYGMARLMGHQALSLNAIVANRVLKQFSKSGHKAVQELIVLALDKICNS